MLPITTSTCCLFWSQQMLLLSMFIHTKYFNKDDFPFLQRKLFFNTGILPTNNMFVPIAWKPKELQTFLCTTFAENLLACCFKHLVSQLNTFVCFFLTNLKGKIAVNKKENGQNRKKNCLLKIIVNKKYKNYLSTYFICIFSNKLIN